MNNNAIDQNYIFSLHKSQTLSIPKLFRLNDPRCEEQCDIRDRQWQYSFRLNLQNDIARQTQSNNAIFKSSHNYSDTVLYLCKNCKYITAAKYYNYIYGRNNTIAIIMCLSN